VVKGVVMVVVQRGEGKERGLHGKMSGIRHGHRCHHLVV